MLRNASWSANPYDHPGRVFRRHGCRAERWYKTQPATLCACRRYHPWKRLWAVPRCGLARLVIALLRLRRCPLALCHVHRNTVRSPRPLFSPGRHPREMRLTRSFTEVVWLRGSVVR